MIESDYHDMILLLTAEGSRPMETVDLSTNAFKLPRNLRCLCIGASESGKSTWISNLIKNKDKLFHSPGYAKFIFCSPNIGDPTRTAARDERYREQLEEWVKPSKIVFFNKIISEEELMGQADDTVGKILLVVDDFSQELFSNDLTYKLFTRLSSHGGIDSVVSVHQGVKSAKTPGKWYSLILNNSNYIVIFRNLSSRGSIGKMSADIFPYGRNFLQRCLNDATEICGTHAYICVDANLRNELNVKYGVRTNIFGENDNPMFVCRNPKAYDAKY